MQHLWWEGAFPPPEAVACAAGHIRQLPAPRALSGAIFSMVEHAICACHFLLTIRCQSKGPGAYYCSSFPLHKDHEVWQDTRCSRPHVMVHNWFSHLKQMITEILFTRLIKSLLPKLTTGWPLHMANTNNLSQWLLGEAALHKEPRSAGGPTTPVHGCRAADASASSSVWVTTEMQLHNTGIACGMGRTLQQEQLLGLCRVSLFREAFEDPAVSTARSIPVP